MIKNKIITEIELSEGCEAGTILCSDGSKYRMSHENGMYISAVEGFDKVIGHKIISVSEGGYNGDHHTEFWFTFGTDRHDATVRWYADQGDDADFDIGEPYFTEV